MRGVNEHERRLMRRRMYASRARLSAVEVERLSAAGCTRLLDLPAFGAARHVVVYAAMGNELDPAAVAARAFAEGKSVYYPATDADGEPEFQRVRAGVVPGTTAEGLLVAGGDAPLPREAGDVLFVVPGVAFDRRGVRLGRGDGWYDRALARYPAGGRLGIGYDFQLVPHLPAEPWDVSMDAVVTDERLVGEARAIAGH
jgi:5-formyltetrahydrofolate cyclo-ligase